MDSDAEAEIRLLLDACLLAGKSAEADRDSRAVVEVFSRWAECASDLRRLEAALGDGEEAARMRQSSEGALRGIRRLVDARLERIGGLAACVEAMGGSADPTRARLRAARSAADHAVSRAAGALDDVASGKATASNLPKAASGLRAALHGVAHEALMPGGVDAEARTNAENLARSRVGHADPAVSAVAKILFGPREAGPGASGAA